MEEYLGNCLITVSDRVSRLKANILKSYDGLSDFGLILGSGIGSELCCLFIGGG